MIFHVAEYVALTIQVTFSVLVAVRARSRGYSPFLWFSACMLSGPFLLIVLAWLPDRSLMKAREREQALLQQECAASKRAQGCVQQPDIPAETIGDAITWR